MGKRARKTRWRALDIADEHSDSEESNTNSSAVSSRTSRSYSNGIYSKNSYSSQSTPARRRYNQYDGSAKSTRSSSTTSENKITFNEDEYTRITTPRQDVLFKKGYLNKPKSYQTQTSTGNSTVSTGNSTENGTPDHQSTDLDYESQFMFPNGFVDQNGIYYVNSYEPYPLMLFNPPTYYHECSNIKSKRMSIGSLSESMSPNNEESTSQDLSPSGGDASNSVSDYSGGPPVYNMVFPGYYVDGSCTPTDLANGHHFPHEPVKKFKKRRERQTSKNIQENSSENTDENSSDENSESNPPHEASSVMTSPVHQADPVSRLKAPGPELLQTSQDCSHNEAQISEPKEELKTVCENSNPSDNTLSDGCADIKTESIDENAHFNQAQPNSNHSKSSVLKPDAEEFVPRSYINIGPPPHIKMLPTNFMPIPLVPINDFGGQNFAPHPAFIPPGIPVNFIPHPGQKLFPPGPGFVNFAPPMIHETKIEEIADKTEENEEKENQSTATPSHTPALEESKPIVHSKAIDIATVVSKLEAVKQQENVSQEEDSTVVLNETKPFIGSPRFKNPSGKRDYYNKYRGTSIHSGEASPQIKNGPSSPQFYDASNHVTNYPICNGNDSPKKQINGESLSSVQNGQTGPLKYRNSPVRQVGAPSPVQSNSIIHRNSPVRHIELAQQLQNGNVTEKLFDNAINQYNKAPTANSAYLSKIDSSKQIRNSPERLNRNWKYNRNQNSYENHHQNSYARSRRVVGQQNNQNYSKPPVNGFQKSYVNGELSPNEHYSETLRKAHIISVTSSPQSKKHINVDNPEKTVEKVADVSKSQWISVSNRKKKKNKNMEDSDLDNDPDFSIEPAKPENTSSDFESYDVSQLVDVVPVTPSAEKENNIEDILSIIAQNEAPEVLANGQQTPPDIKIPEVSDIEKDIIVKIEEQRESSPEKIPKEDLHTVLISKIEENKNEVAHASEMLPVKEDRAEKEEETFRTKKRSKKGTQKPLTKKVIITDIDLSMTVTEVKTPVKKIATKVEEVDSIKTQPQVPVVIVSEESTTVKETTQQVSLEQTEKKSKKRKKNKTPKSNQNDSLSESNVISNTSDDSIEFRTENSLLTESIDRTNDDVSLELEKLIQRGMYSSLQEKIKSIHVEPEADGFFKNFQAVPSSGMEKATTPHGFMKTPDFNRIFQSTRQFIKPNSVSLKNHNSDNKVEVDDSDYKDTKTSSSAPDSADARSGLFLVNAKEVQEVQEIQEAPTDATIEPKSPATENEDHEDSKKLYPITQAVKEWMSKTREATPEVEILKSPTTIQKEFGDNGNPDDLNDPSDLDEDDEVTLFSTDDTLGQEHPDLLEYWEDDITNNSITASKCCEKLEDGNHPKLYSKGTCCTKCQNDSIKEGEEELEIYESKYGKNYLFPKLQRELKEKESRPKSLPHRTICCSLQ